ncbi:MAG TPA: iron-containing alcohol dehydrogenase [Pseudorhodoplanes sp.]|jgi:alcohol dehydrogenase|nr:iron-containing alcohol dehydrogenase [Pseudorhodoplanes sp.]
MQLRGNWNYPTTVRFGAGRIAELPEAVKAAGMKNPLFVTDPVLAKLPMTASALQSLTAAGLAAQIFADIKPNPVDMNLAQGIAAFRSGKHDGVVAFGGGSALDVGKLIAFMHGQSRPVWDFEDVGDWWTRADASAISPIVAVPTTAGTGSEVGRAAVLTHESTHTKKIIFHPQMMPKITICDPELTVGMPALITAGTGFDAFAHCLEAYCAPFYHPFADGIAVEGIRLVKDNLASAVRDGSNMEARAHMMAAAAAGATAFQKGLGAIHSLSHPVGSLYDTHHGLTNGVFMPYVLAFNKKEIEDKIKRLAAYIGLKPNFRAFMDFVLELREQAGVPHTLEGLKVGEDKIEMIVEMAPKDPTAGGNPVTLDKRAARTIFKRALEGRL